jgi:CheY-like chemotaxis protein
MNAARPRLLWWLTITFGWLTVGGGLGWSLAEMFSLGQPGRWVGITIAAAVFGVFTVSLAVVGFWVERRFIERPASRFFAGFRILVVDDIALNRLIADELLRSEGAEVTVASSGVEALDLLSRAVFDLILMDLQMPGMDGYETTRRIRDRYGPTPPIVALTAETLPADKTSCVKSGMGYVSKPLNLAALAEAIPQLRRRGRRAAKDKS